jgi:hypothetical protein
MVINGEKTDFSVTFSGECEFFLRLWYSGLHAFFFTAVSKERAASIFASIQPQDKGSVFLLHGFLPLRTVKTLKNAYYYLLKTFKLNYDFVWVHFRGVKNHRALALL